MASWGVGSQRDGGSSRLSGLVAGAHTALKSQGSSGQDQIVRDNSRERQEVKTSLLHSEDEGEESSEDEEELLRNAVPYDEDEESVMSRKVLFEAQALGDFQGEEGEDLSFKEREILTILESSREDGWLMAENALGERGLVPSNYIRKLTVSEKCSHAVSPADPSVTPRRGRDLWSKLKQTILKQTSLADVLTALGAIPSGFRDSTMAKLLAGSSNYLTSTWIKPQPSFTGMAFKDLKWNHSGDYLQPIQTKISCDIAVIMARMVPLPGKGLRVLSRHIRLAIFNKNDILSNIHTVRAVWSSQEEKNWKFVSKSQTATNSLYHQVCTVRVDSNDTNLELLFELGITFIRVKTGEKGEISCGWSSLPLYNHSGEPMPSRTYELKLHGGTPFESGVDLDASNIKASGNGLLPSLLRARHIPRLYIRLMTPSRSRKVSLALLPPTIVTSATYIQAISCFRHSVGSACLRGRLGLPLQKSIVKPSFNAFLSAIDQPDVMDNILVLLQERLKLAKRVNKQNLAFVSEQLECILLQHTYPLLNSVFFPVPLWADEEVEKERLKFMDTLTNRTDLSTLLGSDIRQNVMNTSEQSFNIFFND